jgi:hypothetical protein
VASNNTPTDRAREFIDDVLKVNAQYGIPSVKSKGAYEAAVADAARSYTRISRHRVQ